MTRVLIVDDHMAIRDSFQHLFSTLPDFKVVGDLADANMADFYCERLRPDLVLLDVCTEGEASGLEAAARLRARYPDMKIIVMSGFDEISYCSRAEALGADAFVYKSKSLAFFSEVILDVMNGKRYFPQEKNIELPAGEAPFSAREMEVLRLLCQHKSRKEIAEALNISEFTVKRHVSNMLEKSGFSDSVELAFYMILKGWINPLY